MTYANLPYPDLPNLPIFLSQNPYERRVPDNPPELEEWDNEIQPEQEDRDRDLPDTKSSLASLPIRRLSNLLFTCDDPERTAFFVPLMILLVVHAMFLLYIHVYAPESQQGDGTDGAHDFFSWEYLSLRGKRFYDVDVDGLKSSTVA